MPPPGTPAAPGDSGGNIFGILSLIAGIVSVVICWLYGGGLLFGVAGIVLGVQGRKKAALGQANNRSMAQTGLILSIIGAALSALYLILLAVGFGVMKSRGRM